MVDYYLELAYALGCPAESPRLELATLPTDEQAADLVWSRLSLRGGSGVVTFNSSGAYGAAKLWPADAFRGNWRAAWPRSLDHDVLVLCGPSERQTGGGDRAAGRSSARGEPGRRAA